MCDMPTRSFIYLRSEANSPHAVGGVEFALTRWQWQRLQQRQANTHMHNVKRFATSALPISFRCHGDVISDVSKFGAKQVVVVHTQYSQCLATLTLRISFHCHVGAIIDVWT